MRSCINYNTFRKLNVQLTQREVPKVIGADGGDLGSMGTVQLNIRYRNLVKVTQKFHHVQRTKKKYYPGCGLCEA